MATTTDLGRVREKSSGKYTAVLKDETGAVIPASALTAITLTLYDLATNAIINNRDGQNVLNANNVTIDNSGNLVWSVQAADHALVRTSGRPLEKHRAVFEYTWSSGTKQDWHAVEFQVESEYAVS